jgi:hypothetical protein
MARDTPVRDPPPATPRKGAKELQSGDNGAGAAGLPAAT